MSLDYQPKPENILPTEMIFTDTNTEKSQSELVHSKR